MAIVFEESAYNPLPSDMKGTFYEIPLGERRRFFEIYYIRYSIEDVDRLKAMQSLEESPLGSYLQLISFDDISSSTCFLYKLQTYVADPSINDLWDFNESISDYQEYGFVSFFELEEFCKNKWSISVRDFVPIEETDMPK